MDDALTESKQRFAQEFVSGRKSRYRAACWPISGS